MKKTGIMLSVLVLISCIAGFSLPVRAQEAVDEVITEMNQVMTVLNDCEARELPDEEAEIITSYKAGSPVWVIGETQNGWFKVSYQGNKGYIPADCITDLQIEMEGVGAVKLTDVGLDSEMASIEAESEMLIEEVERQRSESKRSWIWKTVIGLLIIGIFATGIISTIISGKASKEKNDDTKSDAGKEQYRSN